jgi:hypothetical protein
MENFDPRGAWYTGPEDDDVDSDHLVNRMFYGIENARHMILDGWAEDIKKKYNRPRRMKPYQTGQSWGISWIESYMRLDDIAFDFIKEIERRKTYKWSNKFLMKLKYFLGV